MRPFAAPNRKIKLLIISAIHQRWTHLEWVCQELSRDLFDISFILISIPDSEPFMKGFLEERGIPVLSLHCKLRPADMARTVWRIYRHCRRQKFDVVHTHIFFGTLLGLTAAVLARVPVRINTRHHVRLEHLVEKPGRILPWLDRLSNRVASRVISTSSMLHQVLLGQEKIPADKVRLVRLGIDLDAFRRPRPADEAKLASRYNPRQAAPVVGVVARHYEYKGIQYIIPAFKRLLADYPSAYLMMAGAYGPYSDVLRRQLAELDPERYVLIPFETNPFALYHLCDVLVHTPVDLQQEAFGLVYLEALAAGVPSIFSLSGIAPEILEHRRNAWIVEHRNSEQIHQGMAAILGDPALRQTLVREGRRTLDPAYSARVMERGIEAVYLECLGELRPA